MRIGQRAEISEGDGSPVRWALTTDVNYSATGLPGSRHVSTTVRMRSMNRSPRLAWVCRLSLRQMTKGRSARSAVLFVGGTSEWVTKVPSRGLHLKNLLTGPRRLRMPRPGSLLQSTADPASQPLHAPVIGRRIELPLLIARVPAKQHLPVSAQSTSNTPGFTDPARDALKVS